LFIDLINIVDGRQKTEISKEFVDGILGKISSKRSKAKPLFDRFGASYHFFVLLDNRGHAVYANSYPAKRMETVHQAASFIHGLTMV
jgi:hypothetical protein